MNVENATVFVVEDEPDTRESFAALFVSQGLAVETFCSGEEFLQKVDPSKPGCIVADFRLQGINGIKLHDLLVEAEYSLPVILISGYLNVRTATNALRQGIYRVLEKPYQDDELICAVQDAMQHDREFRKQKVYRLDFSHRLQSLDARERLTLEMIVTGHGNRSIESKLGLSTRSVDRIRSSILEKMDFLSFVELSAAYGAAHVDDRTILTMPPIDCGDSSGGGNSNKEAVDCLCAGLLRVQSVLLADEGIGEDFRPVLRDAEVALSKALGKIGAISPAPTGSAKLAST